VIDWYDDDDDVGPARRRAAFLPLRRIRSQFFSLARKKRTIKNSKKKLYSSRQLSIINQDEHPQLPRRQAQGCQGSNQGKYTNERSKQWWSIMLCFVVVGSWRIQSHRFVVLLSSSSTMINFLPQNNNLPGVRSTAAWNHQQGRGYLLTQVPQGTTTTTQQQCDGGDSTTSRPANPGLNRIGLLSLTKKVANNDNARMIENAELRKDLGVLKELVGSLQERMTSVEEENEELRDEIGELIKKKKKKHKSASHRMGLRGRTKHNKDA
jgi:hypothetical protein